MAVAVETFFLDENYGGTLQKQLQEIVTSGILSGRFLPGERMPSSRKLAAHLGISRITVTLAYTELLSNDYLTALGRSGYFISETAPLPPRFEPSAQNGENQVDWSRALGQRFTTYSGVGRPLDWRNYKFPFIYGQTDASLFDHGNWRRCALQALGQRDFEALTADYYDQDDPKLIEYIVRHILPRRGITARPEQILVTMGAQNALWMAAQILLTQRRTAVIENPCYPELREILNQTRCNTLSIDVDIDGISPDAIPADADVVFTTASHHCPTNVTMPLDRRRALLNCAEKHDFVVVEDDYEFEMSFLKPAYPALKSLDHRGAVIYIGSFSKSLFPGLRLGYMVASETFIREARALRALLLRHPPGHIQRTAAYFLSLGYYDAQISRMSKIFAQRREVMFDAMQAAELHIAGQNSFGGSSFWMAAPTGVDTTQLSLDLRQDGVLIEPGAAFFHPHAVKANYYRLAYSSIPASRIAEGIEKIATAMRKTGYT
ncbi:PLP-dependent aminotransferase family protein [Parasulfitobacter algicola]|uniref:PLP-dependent aminotransferase family protein n=1 Tax=Parasulfitobacter algicola TaxID=2614809 RepID=A0ABX2IP20_9RHOB|nr:PLP-dependent aminotransferase family protein [Sulfitobacter algicola]NSX54618.1 PLP-dependent aminotransferase family protein [Sulfitobacter algicola]